MDMTTCVYLISQAIHRDHDEPHVFEDYSGQKPYEYAKNSGDTPLGMGFAGIYSSLYTPLVSGQMGLVRLTEDGKMMVDATVTATVEGGWANKAYHELTVTSTVTNIVVLDGAVPFIGKEFMVFNDGTKDVFYDFGASVAVGTSPRLMGGEAIVDNYSSSNIRLVCKAGETAAVRVWIRG